MIKITAVNGMSKLLLCLRLKLYCITTKLAELTGLGFPEDLEARGRACLAGEGVV